MTFMDMNYTLALPEIFMVCMAFILLIFGVFGGNKITSTINSVTIGTFLVALIVVAFFGENIGTAFNEMFVVDRFAQYLKILILIGASFTLLMSVSYLSEEGIFKFEFPVLILMSVIGMFVMVSANNLLTLYLGLELQSLSLYVLAAFHRDNLRSAEAGLKYFILGALSSGLLLFGSSILYGYTGTTSFDGIATFISETENVSPALLVGMVFLLAGLAFKISAVPFHMWTPDVYEGTPTPVTAFFAIAPKVAAIGLIARIVAVPLGEILESWQQILIFLSVASMTLGAFAALVQDNIKRLLAYSSIGNMGYAIIGLIAGTAAGMSASLVYITIYMVMTAGTFAVLLSLKQDNKFSELVPDLAGLSKSQPVMAYILAIMMFSMAGIPPLAGFFGKWVIFQSAVDVELFWLAVYGVVTSVISAYYYLRIIKVMFFDEGDIVYDDVKDYGRLSVMVITSVFIVLFIIQPDMVFEPALSAAEAVIPSE